MPTTLLLLLFIMLGLECRFITVPSRNRLAMGLFVYIVAMAISPTPLLLLLLLDKGVSYLLLCFGTAGNLNAGAICFDLNRSRI